jgi:hypothetical protein
MTPKPKTLIGKRVAVAKNLSAIESFNGIPALFGETGTTVAQNSLGQNLTVQFDCGKKTYLYEDELYFPDSPEGYNQACFR